MLFNDNVNPVTDDILIYYSNYFSEDNKPYILSVPVNQAPMGDVCINDFHINTIPTEGEKYFKMGNYHTSYDPDAGLADRMMALSSIRQDTTYFDNSLTSDSTSYFDINDDIITNLVHNRE